MKGIRKFMQGGGLNRPTRDAITIGVDRMVMNNKTIHNKDYVDSLNGGNHAPVVVAPVTPAEPTVVTTLVPTPVKPESPKSKNYGFTDDELLEMLYEGLATTNRSKITQFDIMARVSEVLKEVT